MHFFLGIKALIFIVNALSGEYFHETVPLITNGFLFTAIHLFESCGFNLAEKYCLVLAAESLISWLLLLCGRFLGLMTKILTL
jgi:hypothetical protein